jgi:hypothetical protein
VFHDKYPCRFGRRSYKDRYLVYIVWILQCNNACMAWNGVSFAMCTRWHTILWKIGHRMSQWARPFPWKTIIRRKPGSSSSKTCKQNQYSHGFVVINFLSIIFSQNQSTYKISYFPVKRFQSSRIPRNWKRTSIHVWFLVESILSKLYTYLEKKNFLFGVIVHTIIILHLWRNVPVIHSINILYISKVYTITL